MKIKVLTVQEPENRDTHINNYFIMNHMKDAPSGFVRIYLYFLMESQLGKGVDIEETANNLALPVTYIKEALYYWQETGVIEIEDRLSPVEKTERAPFDEKINEMFIMIERVTKRPLSSKEALEISSWIKDYNMTPEAIIYGYTHAGKNKSSPGTNYVEAIIREWADYGLFTTKEIEEHLEKRELSNQKHKRIFKALGFSRFPTEAERTMMDRWFDEGFLMDEILDACGKTTGIPNPNLNYINQVLENRREKREGVLEKLGKEERGSFKDRYAKLREKNKFEADERKEEVYRRSPGIKTIDEEIADLYMRFSREALTGNIEEQKKLKERLNRKNEDRAYLLTEAGFPLGYTDVKYNCESCKDTGVTEQGMPCKCREQIQDL